MALWLEIALALLCGPALWLAGAIFFDFVHWVLHALLRSRYAAARALAWPHAVHHQWIDTDLELQWRLQNRNILCHIVPEYLTQLGFTAGVALVLPWPFAAVLAALQTLVFAGILSQRGLDPNHRPIDLLDAYRPGFVPLPAYHALHHAYPDAYYSSYTKLIDGLVGGCAPLRGRRFRLQASESAFRAALEGELRARGAELIESGGRAELEVLVVFGREADLVPEVEAFIAATRLRRLPPEVWACVPEAGGIARSYHADVRVGFRTIELDARAQTSADAALRASRRAISRARRGFHYVHSGTPAEMLRGWWRFRALEPEPPAPAARLRHRVEVRAGGL